MEAPNYKDWRKKEESYSEIVKKYPDVSPFIITQIDVQRRGMKFTDAARHRCKAAEVSYRCEQVLPFLG